MTHTIFDINNTGKRNGITYPPYVMDQIMAMYDVCGGLIATYDDGNAEVEGQITHTVVDLERHDTVITATMLPSGMISPTLKFDVDIAGTGNFSDGTVTNYTFHKLIITRPRDGKFRNTLEIEQPTSGSLWINWRKTNDGVMHYGVRGHGDLYAYFYQWLRASSYHCTSSDMPWDYFVFTYLADDEKMLSSFGCYMHDDT